MRILHISDTHGCHRELTGLPEADVLVHSGDFTMAGSEHEALDFMNWLCGLDYPEKIFICGNHDECMYDAGIDRLDSNVHYLCNSGVEIGGVRFYGVPLFLEDCISGRQDSFYDSIPADTDVLITHAPPFGILDCDGGINYGSRELLARLSAVKPRLHLFGHIYPQHGTASLDGTFFSNGAIMSGGYIAVNSPAVIDFCKISEK